MEKRVYLVGPPGSGKTLLLALRGVQWVREGCYVSVLTAKAGPSPVALVIFKQVPLCVCVCVCVCVCLRACVRAFVRACVLLLLLLLVLLLLFVVVVVVFVCLFVCLFAFFAFLVLPCPWREIQVGCLTCIKRSSRKNSATHSYQCVQYFPVSKRWYGCQCFGIFNVRTDVNDCDCTRGLYGHRKRVCTGS